MPLGDVEHRVPRDGSHLRCVGTEIGLGHASRDIQLEAANGGRGKLQLESLASRPAAVDRRAVAAVTETEILLNVVPVDLIHRAVGHQLVIRPGGLEAQLVIPQRVRLRLRRPSRRQPERCQHRIARRSDRLQAEGVATLRGQVHFSGDAGFLQSDIVGERLLHVVIFCLHQKRRRRRVTYGNVPIESVSLAANPEVSRINRHSKIRATVRLIGGIERGI